MDNEIAQRYQIKEKIGAGGMGTVYRAWDRELERDVALKWLPAYLGAEENFAERFRREVRVIAHLEHPHIVPIYDVGASEGRPFIIMRLLDGGTLRHKVAQGNFNLAELIKAMEQIADALSAAHARQIIHRDIKPGNILFDKRGSAFLSDFGIAKVLDSGTQLTGSGFIGTPAYMSPEQFTGQGIDGRSDQYSLAVVVYEALTGALPFAGNTAQMMYNHINTAPADIDLDKHPIPSGLNPILQKSLEKDPNKRYARVADFATAMAIAMRMEPTTSSVLLPVIVGAPSPAQRPPTAATEIDTAIEQDTVGEDYRTGLEALALGQWAAALAAFDRVLDVDPTYGNTAEFKKQAQDGLEAATAAEKTSIDLPDLEAEKTSIETPAMAAAAVAAALTDTPAAEVTVLEPSSTGTGAGAPPAAPPPISAETAVAPQEDGRKIPIWAIALLALLLLLGGGYIISRALSGGPEREPSAAESAPVAAVVADTATSEPATDTPVPQATDTIAPPPSETPLPAVIDSPDDSQTETGTTSAETGKPTPKSIIGAGSDEPTDEPPTAESATEEPPTAETPTAEPTAETPLAAAIRVIVSSANLRQGPGTIYPIAGVIYNGEEAAVIASNRNRTWYNVELVDGRRVWLAASVAEPVDAAAMNSVQVAATIPVAPTLTPTPTPIPPTATLIPTLPPLPTSDGGGDGGDGGGGDGGGGDGGNGGGSEPKPKYTAEPP